MTTFARNPEAAKSRNHDVIVVGGGIYGMFLTLEAARRGLKPLLVERADFGGATSLHSLRILHGGLRYLQHLDLPRFFESVNQRGWLMRHFPPLCRVLPCLMPLYGRGLKRPAVFQVALKLNRFLSYSSGMPSGRVIGIEETLARFPHARRDGLKGGALWHDGQVLSPQRLHAELLHWAAELGAMVLNYAEALELKHQGSRVAGLVTRAGEFKAPIIINAAGPWAREVATRLDRDRPELMTPSLTFNVLLKVPPPSIDAVAVEGTRMYFLTPHRAGFTFAGTIHRAWEGISEPTPAMIEEFIQDLNRVMPEWPVRMSDVLRVTAGVLPSRGPGKADMAHRSTFVKHDIEGLFSVCGIKYTTAQAFASKTIDRIFGRRPTCNSAPNIAGRESYVEPAAVMALNDAELRQFAVDEAVTCPEDLLERRIDWIPNELARRGFETRLNRVLASREAFAV
jgi:glycerol-3-phosphate dehydrogenase